MIFIIFIYLLNFSFIIFQKLIIFVNVFNYWIFNIQNLFLHRLDVFEIEWHHPANIGHKPHAK